MSTKENKALVRRWYEETNKGKAAALAVIDELCANSCILHGSSSTSYNVEEYKKYTNELINTWPDTQFTIDDIIIEGDKAAARVTMTGTHKGAFMGIPPTNKKMTMWMIQMFRISRGKIVEGWSRTDTLGLMQQLGVVPTPKKEK